MILRRLRDTLHLFDLGQDLFQQRGLIEQLKSASRLAFRQHFQDLIAHAFMAHLVNLRRQLADGGESPGVNRVSETCVKAPGAQHAQLVFGEAGVGLANGADGAALDVSLAPNVVQDFFGIWIEQQAVDGEVAPLQVKADILGKTYLVRMAAVRVGAVAAESCDLGGKVGACAVNLTERWNQHHAELRADRVGLGKKLHHLLRSGGSSNVKIGGIAVEKQIANTAAHQVRGMSLGAQRERDAGGFTSFVRTELHPLLDFHRRERRENRVHSLPCSNLYYIAAALKPNEAGPSAA